MIRIIKYCVLAFFLILVCFAIIKDKVFDTPEKSKQKVASFLSKSAQNSLETNIFGTNKTYVYKMYYWSIVPMGELRFRTQVDDLGNVFSFEARTKGSFAERFIKASAAVNSYFSKNIRLPYKYTEITDVDGKVKTKEFIFDQANLITTVGERKIKIPLDTYDPVSAFVRMLSLPLKGGAEQKIRFLSGRNVYVLKSTVLNESSGIVEVLVDMKREDLTSSHGAKLHVWITQDNVRIPLAFKSWSPVGYVSVVLQRIETENI